MKQFDKTLFVLMLLVEVVLHYWIIAGLPDVHGGMDHMDQNVHGDMDHMNQDIHGDMGHMNQDIHGDMGHMNRNIHGEIDWGVHGNTDLVVYRDMGLMVPRNTGRMDQGDHGDMDLMVPRKTGRMDQGDHGDMDLMVPRDEGLNGQGVHGDTSLVENGFYADEIQFSSFSNKGYVRGDHDKVMSTHEHDAADQVTTITFQSDIKLNADITSASSSSAPDHITTSGSINDQSADVQVLPGTDVKDVFTDTVTATSGSPALVRHRDSVQGECHQHSGNVVTHVRVQANNNTDTEIMLHNNSGTENMHTGNLSHVHTENAIQNQTHFTTEVNKKSALVFEYSIRKDSYVYIPVSPKLKMILQSENMTVLYSGSSEYSPFTGVDKIWLKDTAFGKTRVWFSLQIVSDNGSAYIDSAVDMTGFHSLHCLVQGLTQELIYVGWHRWDEGPSNKASLTCQAGFSLQANNYAITTTQYPLWFSAEKGDMGYTGLVGLQPSVSGMYTCIAVDSGNNAMISAYYDIRVVRVVTSSNASIIPQNVTILEHDTRSTFLYKNCRGYLSPMSTAAKYAGRSVHVLYLDNSTISYEAFSLIYLKRVPWIRAKTNFDNLKLSSSFLARCRIQILTNSDTEMGYMDLYFRHDAIKTRTQRTFTAVTNEVLTFYCSEEHSRGSTAPYISYFDGNCGENKSYVDSRTEISSISLTIGKPACVICASDSSEIKLQINVEDDLRFKIINGTNQRGPPDCSSLWDMNTQYPIVINGTQCEKNAVSLVKAQKQLRNISKKFIPLTYRPFYTSRQFLVCQNQPLTWSQVTAHAQTAHPGEDLKLIEVLVSVFAVVLALLILQMCVQRCRRVRSRQGHWQSNMATSSFTSQVHAKPQESHETDNWVDCVNPGEIISESRISVGALIGSGKFGQVFHASIKDPRMCDDGRQVAVKRLKGNENCSLDKEIQILRMILPHLNIVKYYGFCLSPESNFLIMELVKGPSLLEYLREQRVRVPGFFLTLDFRSCPADAYVMCQARAAYANIQESHNGFQLDSDELNHKKSSLFNEEFDLGYCNDEELGDTAPVPDHNLSSDGKMEELEHDKNLWREELEDNAIDENKLLEQEDEFYNSAESYELCDGGVRENLCQEICSICRQVARGMAHVASLNIIHCDLAARNVVTLLSSQPLVVKICDFGMAQCLPEGQIIHKKDNTGPRPFRWMSPEALNKGEFSTFSDVWSYGVLCWEVVTLGSTPYGDLQTFAAAARVAVGHHPPRPSNCDPELFAVLRSCWRLKPTDRPTFDELLEKWSGVLELNSEYLELKSLETNAET